jgi:hypothetical protein
MVDGEQILSTTSRAAEQQAQIARLLARESSPSAHAI